MINESGKGDFGHEKASLNEQLEKEQEKLRKLGEEALKNGIPLTQDEAFMAQNRKVDALVVKIIKETEQHRKKQRER
ncbi:MAG TPA: hypothetical protein DCK76_05315 [Desulfotomaculum sp.]|jgi:hypothetical protein|uniref:Uncharacterized protein n=2 Tax=Dehalobacterium formicoaceticum TaxID=51515 RepID=A0ABT1Y5J0_9FIRM|nr:hypothetical protein [Dehalobacterium formicoaceticum]MCR6546154.1 hypothetical protein [Dehalobacterium formicoaceticum]HAG10794.1 hypothetical protein [Desulfotomaculum sp.]